MKKLNIKLLIQVIKWIVLSFKTEESVPVSALVQLVEDISRIQENRGVKGLIVFVKATRSNLLNYLSGNSMRDPLSACTKDGIPKVLKDLIPFVRRGSTIVISLILTILMSTRSLKSKADPDISSITQP